MYDSWHTESNDGMASVEWTGKAVVGMGFEAYFEINAETASQGIVLK
jgi:hypothetical protein